MSSPARTSAAATERDDDRSSRLLVGLLPAAVYLAGRLACVLTLRWIATLRNTDLLEQLSSWDGLHFLAIAQYGYDWTTDPSAERSPAFFPGLPAVMSALSWSTGVSARTSGLLISLIAGLVAVYGLMSLARFVPGLDRAGGLLLIAVFSLAPMSIVLSMTYTEALFCALAVWSLVFLLRDAWLVAGGLSLLAGLVRPSGLALAAAIGVAAVIAIVRGRATWRTWVGAVLAPLGVVGWIGDVGYRLGDVAAWFRIQKLGWHSSFDFGAGTLEFVYRTLRDAPAVLDVVTVGLMVAAVVLLVVSVRQRQPYELWLYSLFSCVQVLLSDGVMNSKGRLLIPAFTLLLPLAVYLNRERRSTAVASLVLLGAMSCWYSAYAVVIYGYAI